MELGTSSNSYLECLHSLCASALWYPFFSLSAMVEY